MFVRNTLGALLLLISFAAATLACTLPMGAAEPTAVAQAASVVMIAPENNSAIVEGTPLTLAVTVINPGGVGKVEFVIDDQPIGTQTPTTAGQTTFTARQAWTANAAKGYLISAVASDPQGTRIGEAKITVSVVGKAQLTGTPAATAVTAAPATQPAQPAATQPAATAAQTSAATLPSAPAGATAAQPAATTPPPANVTIVVATNPTTASITVKAPSLNIRAGDGTTFSIIGALSTGDTAEVVGRNAARTWLAIRRGQTTGWVFNDPALIEVAGDVNNVALVRSPATPVVNQPTVLATAAGAPTTVVGTPDLVVISAVVNPPNPKVGVTFTVTVVVKNNGSVEAPKSTLMGFFRPGDEKSPVEVPKLQPGEQFTAQLAVTIKTAGTAADAYVEADHFNQINEGPGGEGNNRFTVPQYTVSP